ncbi:hypothetical protein VFPBJ_04618 [Purpureocillium lilacinum]|uniref:Uncharacterized protein n=1 Tax=Purpureocillium lilacinum TaxID=33203 RepID=A0A179GVW2_PURLI|nr:hypothetical protein VFPBJ_04618 [Purpureocillium lilacinum]
MHPMRAHLLERCFVRLVHHSPDTIERSRHYTHGVDRQPAIHLERWAKQHLSLHHRCSERQPPRDAATRAMPCPPCRKQRDAAAPRATRLPAPVRRLQESYLTRRRERILWNRTEAA